MVTDVTVGYSLSDSSPDVDVDAVVGVSRVGTRSRLILFAVHVLLKDENYVGNRFLLTMNS